MIFLELGSPSEIPREAVLVQIPKTIPHKEHMEQCRAHLEPYVMEHSGPHQPECDKQDSHPSSQALVLLLLPTLEVPWQIP